MSAVRTVLLAAGEGRRMGGNKGLIRFRGRPLIHHVLDVIEASAVASTVVVTGAESEALGALLAEREVTVAHNAGWRSGQTSSLKAGIAALPADTDAFLIHPVDHALVTSPDLDALVAAFEANADESLIARPICGDAFGHPVLFAAAYRDRFLALSSEEPGSMVYRSHRDEVVLVPVDNPLIDVDLDTPDDLRTHE